MKEIPIYNRINLIINKQELDYLAMVVEQNLEDAIDTESNEVHNEMLEDLYSKLIILNK